MSIIDEPGKQIGPKGSALLDILQSNTAMVFIFLIVLGVIFTLTSPFFLTTGNLINVLRQTAVVAVLGIGVTYGIISGEIDVSIGSVMALSAVFAAMTITAGYGWIAAVGVGIGTGLLVGAINGAITVYFGVPSFLVTLGMLAAARGFALWITGTSPVILGDTLFTSIFSGDLSIVPIIVIWTAIAAIVGHFVLSYTTFGQHIYATGDNTEAADYTGINTGKIKFTTLMISGGTAGLAGLLMLGRFSSARPTMGSGIELAVIAGVILGGTSLFGGRGWIVGTLGGALLLSVVNNGLVLNGFGGPAQQTIRGVVIILAVVYSARKLEEGGSWL